MVDTMLKSEMETVVSMLIGDQITN